MNVTNERATRYATVEFSASDVRKFADRWPCYDGPDGPVRFTFDTYGNDADLVDVEPRTFSGAAASAMANDARRALMEARHGGADAEFLHAARHASIDPGVFSPPQGGASTAYNVCITYDGAVDAEQLVYGSFLTAERLAEAIVALEADGRLGVTVTHCYVGPDVIEASGYGPFGQYTYDADAGAVSVR